MDAIRWFGLAACGLCLPCVVLLLRYSRRMVRRRPAPLDARRFDHLDQRYVEIQDDVIQSVQAVLLHLHVAAGKLVQEAGDRVLFDAALAHAEEALALARDRNEVVRSMLDPAWDLHTAFAQLARQWPGRPRAAFRVIVEGQERTLRPLIREEMYRIGADALTHYLADTTAKRIEVDIILGYMRFRVRFRDGGLPTPRTQATRAGETRAINGICERGRGIGAIVSHWTSPTAGDELDFDLPAAVAYLDDVTGLDHFLSFMLGERRSHDGR